MQFSVFILLIMGVSFLIQNQFKSRFNKYSQIPTRSGMSGKEVAEKMLHDNNIFDVQVLSAEGMLGDHYDPSKKTVNLSPDVYTGRSVAAAAVAAHECGHAVQHARAYVWLGLRSALVPFVSFSSRILQWVIIAGILTISVFPYLLLAGIVLFAATTLFSFITLPVEFDASRRALAWLDSSNTAVIEEHDMAKDALFWAAMTYVVAALGSLVTLLYYLNIYRGRS